MQTFITMTLKKYFLPSVCTVLFLLFALTSCDTPTGQGAGFGAATGAIIGGAATGRGEGAAVGAGIGALTGALIGAAVEADDRGYYEGRPTGYYPYASRSDRPGFVYSPYPPHNMVDVRGIPHGALVRDPSSDGIFRKP
jgi:outer membrane protein with glycine zipper